MNDLHTALNEALASLRRNEYPNAEVTTKLREGVKPIVEAVGDTNPLLGNEINSLARTPNTEEKVRELSALLNEAEERIKKRQ